MAKQFVQTMARQFKWEIESSREFDRLGFRVVEYVFLQDDDKKRKLLWVRVPFEKTVIDGEANPCFHKDFHEGDYTTERLARKKVEEAFDQYWSVTKEERLHYWETKSMPKGNFVTDVTEENRISK